MNRNGHFLKPAVAALVTLLALAGCETEKTLNVSAPTPEMQRIKSAMAAWPQSPSDSPAIKRPFFATIHMAGHRTTASGLLQYHNARDFRITAATEMGVILFDGRMNWAGVNVLRAMPGIDKGIIGTLITDLTTAFQLPESLKGIEAKGVSATGRPMLLVLKKQGADTDHYTWTFDARTGRVRTLEVDKGLFDTLHIDYLRYDARGWPQEMTVTRKARLYTISFTFTDDGNVAKR